MKRFIYCLFCILFILSLASCKTNDEKYYTVKEYRSIACDEEKTVDVYIYSNNGHSSFMDKDKNSFTLKIYYNRYKINIEDIETFDLGDKYLYCLKFRIPLKIVGASGDTSLIIDTKGKSLSVELGIFEFINVDKMVLTAIGLYGIYSDIHGSNLMTALGITFLIKEEVKHVCLGKYVKGDLGKTIFGYMLPNKINIYDYFKDYDYNYNDEDYTLDLSKDNCVIPIGYKTLLPIADAALFVTTDENTYYMDNFPFLATMLLPDDYPEFVEKGKVFYD